MTLPGEEVFRSELYDYDLPQHRIATHPLAQRDASKLLIYKQGQISEDIFRHLPNALPPGSVLVFNNTKVVPARLLFQRKTGAGIEVFCLQPVRADGSHLLIEEALQQQGGAHYLALVGNSKRWKPQEVLLGQLQNPEAGLPVRLEARWHNRVAEGIIVAFTWAPHHLTFGEVLDALGHTPLPPYLKRQAETDDTHRYQTVYAARPGAVAAPTAGLHFTPQVLEALQANGIATAQLTLHVGAGTFKPLSADDIRQHDMHAEWFEVSLGLIEQIAQQQGPVVAVGTTAMRTLETLYHLGCRAAHSAQALGIPTQLHLSQHDPDAPPHVSRAEAFGALANYLQGHQAQVAQGDTQLMIRPGYRFGAVNGLITNFHQPRSTLMLLVAALVGDDWKRIYQYALEHDFRFLSYGDSSLLWPAPPQ